MSSYEFMQVKVALKSKLQKIIASATTRMSPLGKLKHTVAKLDHKQLKECDGDTKSAIRRIETAIADITKVITSMDGLRSSGWGEVQASAAKAKNELDQANKDVLLEYDCVKS